jgi:hypothetical protein
MLVHEGQLFVEVNGGKIEFRNAYGLKMQPAPDRSVDLEELDRWLATAEPGFDHAGTPLSDGSRLDLHSTVSWMLARESA